MSLWTVLHDFFHIIGDTFSQQISQIDISPMDVFYNKTVLKKNRHREDSMTINSMGSSPRLVTS